MLDGALILTLLLTRFQASPLNGTWELTRIFRAGPVPATRTVPIDSTVYLRITLETHVGDWISGRLYRRYRGEPDRSKVEAGPLRGEGRLRLCCGRARPDNGGTDGLKSSRPRESQG